MAKVYAQETDDAGLHINDECLTQGNCSMSIYKTLKIREDSPENSLQTTVQDIFLGSTFFIGTMATIGLIVSGLMMVFGGASESQFEKGKNGFKYSIIGLLLVMFSYSLIRLVEYIAQGKT